MTDQPSNYAADVECAIGLNVGGDGTEGVYAARDAVLAVRDREMERLKLLVAASSEPGQAVRMAAQYADRAIENGERAKQAKAERDRVQQAACRTAENLRAAEDRVAELEAEAALSRAVLARVRQMADYWEQQLPDVIRTPAVVSALRAVLDRAQQPTNPVAAVEVRQPCPYCADHQMIPRRQYVEHVARLHPTESQPTT